MVGSNALRRRPESDTPPDFRQPRRSATWEHAYRSHRRRRPDPGGPARGTPFRLAPGGPGRPAAQGPPERTGLDPALVEDVIMGCTMTVGRAGHEHRPQRGAGRRLPDTVPGTTVDRQCGSAQQAIHFAAQAVMSGRHGRGHRGWRRVHEPGTHRLHHRKRAGRRLWPVVHARFELHPSGYVGRGHRRALAHRAATRWTAFALRVPSSSGPAHDEGRFENEIVRRRTVTGTGRGSPTSSTSMKGCGADTSLEKLASLAPAFAEDGTSRRARRRRSPTGPRPFSS